MPWRCLLLLILLAPGVAAESGSIEALLRGMSLERKVAQLFMVSFHGARLTLDEAAFLREMAPGAAALFSKNIEGPAQATRLINSWQREATSAGGLPMLIAVDQEGGTIQTLRDGFTRFPAPMLWTATGDADLAYAVGAAMADELRAVGVNMNLAPAADLWLDPLNRVTNRRSFGSAPLQVNPIIGAFIRGLQDRQIIATAKHFPGHGATAVDSHLQLPRLARSRDSLLALDTQPFRAALDAGVEGVMVGHLWLSDLDAEPLPASLSPSVAAGLLRGELGFDGLIMTDALDMDAIDLNYSYGEAAILALLAASDLIAVGAHVSVSSMRRAMDAVMAALGSGRLSQGRIDESVRRILEVKAKYGLLDWRPLDPLTVADRLALTQREALVARLFEHGITVIDKAGLLPLQGKALIVYPGTRPRIGAACQRDKAGLDLLALSAQPTARETDEANRKASLAETVVVFTLESDLDAASLRWIRQLPPHKVALAALWQPPRLADVADYGALVFSYSPQTPATRVVCEVVHGERRATGVFPLSQ